MKFTVQPSTLPGVRKKRFFKTAFTDPSLYLLLLTNSVIGYWAFYSAWPLINLVVIYWCQSVIIGWFNFHRMLRLENFSTVGVKMNGHSLMVNKSSKRKMAYFFVLHYGLFHLVYLIFILVMVVMQDGLDMWEVGLAALGFYVNHRYSFKHQESYSSEAPNIGLVMMYPYARILPMHLVIIFGMSLQMEFVTLLIFVSLKTLGDVIMHVIEHRLWLR